jgi:PAS domain S-box-containing protein
MNISSCDSQNLEQTIIRHPLIVNPKFLLADVIKLMSQVPGNLDDLPNKEIGNMTSQVNSCVLVMENSQLLGIFTQQDLIKLTAEGQKLEGMSVAEVMTRELVTLKMEEFKDIFTALNLLRQHRIRYLPIVGEQGELIGLVTPTSLLAITIRQVELYNYAQTKLAKRHQIETELRLERNFVSTVLNLAGALVLVLDYQGKIIRFNHTCEQTIGYKFDEVKGKFIWEFLAFSEENEHIKAVFRNLKKSSFPQKNENYWLTKNNEERLISWSNNVLFNLDDQIEYIVCTGIDITESRKAEEELRQTRNFLQMMINNLPVGVCVKDASPENFGKFKLWNEACENMYGLTAEQAIGKTDYDFFPKEQADFFYQTDQKAFALGVSQDISEEPIDSFSLGRRILHTTKIPLYDKDHQPEYLLCISEDITEKKQSEEKLQQAKEQLQTVLDAVPGFISWVSTDGYYLGVNHHLAESFKLTTDDFVGQELGFMQNSPQFTEFMYSFLKSPDLAESHVIDAQIKDRKRNYLLIAQKYQQNTAAVVVGIDITERKQTEIALAESEAMLRSVLDSTPSIVTMVNQERKILFINKTVLGLSVEELIGTNIDNYVITDDQHIQHAALERVFNQGEVVNYEIRGLNTNNSLRYYHSQVGPIHRDGQVMSAVIVTNDISKQQAALRDRKQAEAALKESEEKFRLFTENIKSAFWIIDIEGNSRQMVYVSPAFEEIWGRSAEEFYMSYTTALEAIHPADRQHFIVDTPQKQGEYDEEYRIIRPDGVIRWIRSRAFPIKNETDEVYRIIGIAEDITERKQAEIALQSLIESTASTTGQDFFPALVEYISSTLDIHLALVTEFIDNQFHSLGFWYDGQLQPQISYDMRSTPCEILTQQGAYYCSSGIQQLFPSDHKLVALQAESFMGVILSNDFGEPIGTLCVVDNKPIPDPHKFEGILKVFAARASAELQRQRAQEALQQLNRELEARVEQRTLELQESEAELRAIFHQAAVGIRLSTLDGHILKVNQKLCEILGYSQEELLNKTFMDITHPEDLQCHLKELQKLITGKVETFSLEKRYLHKNGNSVWVNLTVSLIRDVNSQPIYLIGVIEDIRDRKLAQEELKRQFAAVEAAIDGIAILSQNNYIYLNKAHVEMFGYTSADQIIGKTWEEVYEPHEINRFQTEIFPILMQQKHWRGEAIAKKKDGSFFEEEVSLTISEQGDLICVCRDISQRKEAERLLEEQRIFLRSIIDNNPNCIFVKDNQGKFLLVNQAMADFHHTTIRELVGRTDAEFYSNTELQRFNDFDQAVMSMLQPIQMLESNIKKATGEECYFQSIRVPLIAPNGQIRGILGVATDITERKLAQDALQQQIERERLVNVITQRIREFLDLQATLNVTVAEIHKLLKVDRVLIYRILPDGTGKVIAEALTCDYESILEHSFPVECFPQDCYQHYTEGHIYALADRNLRKSPSCMKQFMVDMQIRAKLVIPIIQQGTLWGLLIAHQCSSPREWKSAEIELLQQLANQLAIATKQSGLYAQLQIELNERRQTEAELRQVKERLQFLIASSPAVIFTTQPLTKNHYPTQTTYISENVVNLIGYRAEEFLTQPNLWLDRIHPEDAPQILHNLPQLLKKGHHSHEYRWLHRDGEYCWLFDELKLVLDEHGNPQEIIGLRMDISDRKKAEEEICKTLEKEKELSDLKSRFISMTSHEFRTPLAVIASSAGILKNFSHKLGEPQKQKHLQCIQTYVKHTTQLLDDILLINKAEAGKLAFEPTPFGLVDFCRTLLEELQLSAPNHTLVFSPPYLHSLLPEDDFIVCMDTKLLRQILSNLFSNAVKYSSDGSKVEFNLSVQNEIAVFLIQDQGIGISPEDQQHLFESFYRASNVGNTPGTGLGLTIVKKCLDLQGGRITVASEVGVGTTFRVELPLMATNCLI